MGGFDFDEFGAKEGEPTGEEPAQAPQRQQAKAPAPAAPDPGEQIAAQLIAQFVKPAAPPTIDEALRQTGDTYMEEVVKRLEIASLYRMLLTDSIFSDNTEAARIVGFELQAWARERLAVLIGMRDEARRPSQLSDEELETLKLFAALSREQFTAIRIFADKLLSSGMLAGAQPAPMPTPVKRQAAEVRPAPPAPKPAQGLVRRQAPASITPAQAPQPAPTATAPAPAEAPVARKPMIIEDVVTVPDGRVGHIRRQRLQRPAGAVPMPTGAALERTIAIQATAAAGALDSSPTASRNLTAFKNTPSADE